MIAELHRMGHVADADITLRRGDDFARLDPAATLDELARVVKPGGRIGMVEFGVPDNPALRQLWRVHTRLGLPLLGRLVSTAWYEVGRFLGPNIEQFHAAHGPKLGHRDRGLSSWA